MSTDVSDGDDPSKFQQPVHENGPTNLPNQNNPENAAKALISDPDDYEFSENDEDEEIDGIDTLQDMSSAGLAIDTLLLNAPLDGFPVYETSNKIGKVLFSLKELTIGVQYVSENGTHIQRISKHEIQLNEGAISIPIKDENDFVDEFLDSLDESESKVVALTAEEVIETLTTVPPSWGIPLYKVELDYGYDNITHTMKATIRRRSVSGIVIFDVNDLPMNKYFMTLDAKVLMARLDNGRFIINDKEFRSERAKPTNSGPMISKPPRLSIPHLKTDRKASETQALNKALNLIKPPTPSHSPVSTLRKARQHSASTSSSPRLPSSLTGSHIQRRSRSMSDSISKEDRVQREMDKFKSKYNSGNVQFDSDFDDIESNTHTRSRSFTESSPRFRSTEREKEFEARVKQEMQKFREKYDKLLKNIKTSFDAGNATTSGTPNSNEAAPKRGTEKEERKFLIAKLKLKSKQPNEQSEQVDNNEEGKHIPSLSIDPELLSPRSRAILITEDDVDVEEK